MRWVTAVLALAGIVTSIAPAAAPAQGQALDWPDTFTSRLEALALVQTLNAEILASRSATIALENWCSAHRLADAGEAKIVAHLLAAEPKPATAELRQRLAVAANDELKYRRVQLSCGARALSEADNWYVPSRLTAEMNRILETTDTPFGKVVAELKPYRLTFAVNIFWWPLPKGWETLRMLPAATAGQGMAIPDVLFEHGALVYAGGQPISEVHELYQRQLLAFPAPRLPN
jgi:hypothetical protein